MKAADVGSVQNIFTNTLNNYEDNVPINTILQKCVDKHIGKMKISPDYKILRVWFDKKLNSSVPNIIETPDFTPVNLSN
jgi:hypothetical protein